jgi:hypothetical protein
MVSLNPSERKRFAVTKQQTGKQMFYAIAFCASVFAVASLWALRSAQEVAPPPPPIRTATPDSTLSEVDRLKQAIREAEVLRDSYTAAQETAAQARDYEKSSEWARQAAEQQAVINDLWDKVHEANMREGDGSDSPPNGN